MPNPYTDPDLILGLYSDPANEVLLAEYAMQTGGIQIGLLPASGSGSVGGGNVLTITEIQGQSGGGLPCFRGYTPVTLGDGSKMELRDVWPDMMAMAFKPSGTLAARQVTHHHLHGATEFLRITFADGRVTDTNAVHPYWQGGLRYKSFENGLKEVVNRANGVWRGIRIAETELIKADKPFLFHNLTVQGLHNYIANDDGVSNAKQRPDEEEIIL